MDVMSEESRQSPERARKNLSQILTGLQRVGQVSVARALDCSEAKVSKMKDGDLEMLAKLLAACELKVVSQRKCCVIKDEYLWMTRIVSRALANEETARNLLFEEPE